MKYVTSGFKEGIRSPLEIDNEILTDITSVFLGFGKIMFNGSKTTNERHETIPNGTRTITETKTVGYLNRDQLAFVYGIVCAMRKIPPSEYMEGLNYEAIQAIHTCNLESGHHYALDFHQIDQSQDIVNGFKSKVNQTQYIMAELDKHVIYTKKSYCETVHAHLKAGYEKLDLLSRGAVELLNETSADPAMRFLQAIKTKCGIDRLSKHVNEMSQETDRFLEHAREIGRHLSRNSQQFPAPSPEMFNVVACPKDGTKLRLPENSGDLIVKCPICKYRFAYNTSAVLFPEHHVARKLTWWQKLRNQMKRNKSD